jgi:hypothetical protein
MKKQLLLLIAGFILIPSLLFAQEGKKNQSELFNEVTVGYGLGSVYYFNKNKTYSSSNDSDERWSRTLIGPIALGYQRKLTKLISVGVSASYMQRHTTETYTDYYSNPTPTTYTSDVDETLIMALSRVQFTYVRRPFLSLYSAASIGVTVDWEKGTETDGSSYKSKHLLFAGQLTSIGIRVGRSFSGFAEFGFGSQGILQAGLSYKFGKY